MADRAPEAGTQVVVADRWFPSSKTCSGCGTINAGLTLADRVYNCSACGLVIDRDVNAALNLARYTPPPPKTFKTTRKVRWRLEGNQGLPPRQWGWSREAGES